MVSVERDPPGDLLRRRVDLDVAAEPPDRVQHVPGDLTDGAVRGQSHALCASVAVFHERFVGSEVEQDGEGTGAIGRR
jgi:hypothetical protein